MTKNEIQIFESQTIRSEWDEDAEKWWFSVLDVIAVLTEQSDYKKVRNYWKWLKNKLIAEGSQLVSATNQLKMRSADGKYYKTDVIDTEQIFRLIQSGASQDSCRLIHAAHRVLFSAWRSRMTASRSGLSVTGPTGDQSRVFPDQRAGLSSRAWRYV